MGWKQIQISKLISRLKSDIITGVKPISMNTRKQEAVNIVTNHLQQAIALSKTNFDESLEKQAVAYGYAVATMESALAVLNNLEEL